MTRGNVAALVFVVAGLTVAVGIDAQQQSVSIDVQQQAFGGHGQGKPPALVRQFVGGGGWQSQKSIGPLGDRAIGSLGGPGPAASAGAGWQVQLKQRDDDSLSGRVLIVGSPVLDHAQIQGQITGSEVDGVLLDDNGRQVGTFSGAVRNDRVSGTYTTADGDVGDWSWDGALPN